MSTQVSLLEASTFLGVSKATLRNWDKGGKLTATRNPVNGYRMYNLEELVEIKNAMTATTVETVEQDVPVSINSKQIKRLVSKIHSIIRDSDANSNIITRFDEISKLLFVKLCAEHDGIDVFQRQVLETDDNYYKRIQDTYANAVNESKIFVPEQFATILLPVDTVLKCGIELSKVNMTGTSCDIKGLAYEDTIKGTFDKSDNQQYFTPYQIVEFMVSMMKPYLQGTVCDPACGTAGFLTRVASVNREIKLIGLEVDARLAWVSSMNLFIHGAKNFSVKCLSSGGSLGYEAKSYFETMDAIITNPPFGSDYTDPEILSNYKLGFGKSSRRRGILFIEQAWNYLKENGVVAIIIDQGVLNASSNLDVRNFIVSHFEILAVIDLPESAFMPYANVSSSILILKKVSHPAKQNRVFFAKANEIGRKSNGDDDLVYSDTGESRLNSDLPDILTQWNIFQMGVDALGNGCFVANIGETIENDPSMRLDYVYHHPYRKESKDILARSAYKLYTLAELCIERNDSYIPAADSEATSILFTGLANIESFSGKAIQIPTPAASIKSAVKRYESGDILFSRMRPALRKVAAMNFDEGGYASAECAVLQVRTVEGVPLIDPELLSAILRSDFVYGQIMTCVTGIGRPRIGNKDLRKIKIPVPPRKIQEKAIVSMNTAKASVNQLREKAAMLVDEANKLEKNSINNIAQIMSGEVI